MTENNERLGKTPAKGDNQVASCSQAAAILRGEVWNDIAASKCLGIRTGKIQQPQLKTEQDPPAKGEIYGCSRAAELLRSEVYNAASKCVDRTGNR